MTSQSLTDQSEKNRWTIWSSIWCAARLETHFHPFHIKTPHGKMKKHKKNPSLLNQIHKNIFSPLVFFFFYIALLVFFPSAKAVEPLSPEKKIELLPPCHACRTAANSFQKGIDKTARGKYEGGDADWEERKLGSYANSEIRLVEIQEGLCSDVKKGKEQCHSLVEENEELIEEWWKTQDKEKPDFFQYFCIDKLKVCCADNTFGPDCTPCPGGVENPCSGNGKCKGSGTRKGSGECKCDIGYGGGACNTCADGFYQSYKDDSKLMCSKCHKSCQDRCWDGGPKGCELCKPGWLHTSEYGCQDADECAVRNSPCGEQEFCVNLEGSYQCIVCHKSCDGCHGDGADMCTKCAKGYLLNENICIDENALSRSKHMQMARYVTYLGLCIATCIIFKKNLHLAAAVGTAVALYIAASEYSLKEEGGSLLPKFINF